MKKFMLFLLVNVFIFENIFSTCNHCNHCQQINTSTQKNTGSYIDAAFDATARATQKAKSSVQKHTKHACAYCVIGLSKFLNFLKKNLISLSDWAENTVNQDTSSTQDKTEQ